MFGRRPQPTIRQTFAVEPAKSVRLAAGMEGIEVKVAFQIYNKGPGLARDLYSDVRLILPKGGCTAQFDPNLGDWTSRMEFGMWSGLL